MAEVGHEGLSGEGSASAVGQEKKVIATHVLIDESQAARLRELSDKTRIRQSEYLREAVDDLLKKYATCLVAPLPSRSEAS